MLLARRGEALGVPGIRDGEQGQWGKAGQKKRDDGREWKSMPATKSAGVQVPEARGSQQGLADRKGDTLSLWGALCYCLTPTERNKQMGRLVTGDTPGYF